MYAYFDVDYVSNLLKRIEELEKRVERMAEENARTIKQADMYEEECWSLSRTVKALDEALFRLEKRGD